MQTVMMKRFGRHLLVLLALAGFVLPLAAQAETRQPPYWASISAGKARMRTGPGRNFPAIWLYQRASLPVKVIEVYPNWRKIEDPDGERGWVQANLLSEKRTAMVRGGITPMRESADPSAPILWRAEPGVIGRIARCQRGWCEFDVAGRVGYVESASLWGVSPNEAID